MDKKSLSHIFFKICADKHGVPLQNTACRTFAKEK